MTFERRHLFPLVFCLFLCLERLLPAVCFPIVKIHPRQKGSSTGVRRGNGVVQDQEGSLWITQDDGSLRILPSKASDDFEDLVFRPFQLTNRTVYCRSSISLFEVEGIVQFGVYSIIDKPKDANDKTMSRVIAISANGKKLWETIVPGIAQGTPQIGVDGNHIYLTHNELDYSANKEHKFGKVSIIRNDRYGLVTRIEALRDGLLSVMERPAPFSPLSNPYVHENGEVKMYFTESWSNGESPFGFLYEFNGTHIRGLRRTEFSSIVAPLLMSNGGSMFIVGTESSIYSWVEDRPFTRKPTWSQVLGTTKQPIMQQPLVAPDGSLTFILTHNREIFCFNATTGDSKWVNDGKATSPNIIQLSGDGSTLYSIGSDRGIVTRYHASTGRILDQLTCHEIQNKTDCIIPVEGGIYVSDDGNQIKFASIYGDVFIIKFDEIDAALSPTISPSFDPTLIPSEYLTTRPSHSPSSLPSSHPTSAPSMIESEPPSFQPSTHPSLNPSSVPTFFPSFLPTLYPSHHPSFLPSVSPSFSPSQSPSATPTNMMTKKPTKKRTSRPTRTPTKVHKPTRHPTKKIITGKPTKHPTKDDVTEKPTKTPTSSIEKPNNMESSPSMPNLSSPLLSSTEPSTRVPARVAKPTRAPSRKRITTNPSLSDANDPKNTSSISNITSPVWSPIFSPSMPFFSPVTTIIPPAQSASPSVEFFIDSVTETSPVLIERNVTLEINTSTLELEFLMMNDHIESSNPVSPHQNVLSIVFSVVFLTGICAISSLVIASHRERWQKFHDDERITLNENRFLD